MKYEIIIETKGKNLKLVIRDGFLKMNPGIIIKGMKRIKD